MWGAACAALPLLGGAARRSFDGASFAADLDWLVDRIADRYAYLPERGLDLGRVRTLYGPRARAAANGAAFVGVLEDVLGELHDHHATLGTNTPSSPMLVPTGTDLWAEVRDGRATITAVRPGSAAAAAGLRAGDEVTLIRHTPALDAVRAIQPKCLTTEDPEAADWALRVLLAGTHGTGRCFSVRGRELALAPAHGLPAVAPVTWRAIDAGIGSIRIENSLGDSRAVKAFDDALAHLRDRKGILLDLRNTPSGGDTAVAEPMLGRLIRQKAGYQRVFVPQPGKSFERDSWVKTVSPRGPFAVSAHLVVLVDRWTGSMGEGMSIGLDALGRAAVIGTRMAGLCGGTAVLTLPNTGISVHLPVERLYHLDATPREKFAPRMLVDLERESGEDPILARGLAVMRETLEA